MKNLRKNFGSYCVIVFAFILVSCNETLPLREDLSNLVNIKVRSSYITTSHSSAAGSIRALVTVTNNTDETLDDIAAMTGTMEISWIAPKEEERIFNKTRTFTLSSNDIFYAKNFNRLTKRLMLNPGDSVVLFVDWNLKTNDSTYILYYFPSQNDPQCFVYNNTGGAGNRRISTGQNFLVKANVKLFDRLAVLYVQPFSLRQCFMFPHGGEANVGLGLLPCKDFIQFDPCSAIGQ